MKQVKYLLCLLAVILAANSLHAQGLGFYLGGKRGNYSAKGHGGVSSLK